MTIIIYIGINLHTIRPKGSVHAVYSLNISRHQTLPDTPKIPNGDSFDFRGTKTVHHFCAQTWHWLQRLKKSGAVKFQGRNDVVVESNWIKLNQIESDWVRLSQIESDWQALGIRTEEPKNRRILQFFVPSARNGDTQSLFRSEATRLSLLQSTELTISWVLKPQKPRMKPIYDSMWWHSMWWQEYLYRLPEETSALYVCIERKCQPFAYAPPLSPSRLPEAICWQVLLLKKMPIMMMVLKCIEFCFSYTAVFYIICLNKQLWDRFQSLRDSSRIM